MNIGIGNDHTALNLKQEILEFLSSEGYQVKNYGTDSLASVDYPQIAQKLAKDIGKEIDLGILICGTGIGMCISANKVKGIRAAVGSDVYSAKLTKEHNDTQILCLGARVVGVEVAKLIVKTWLEAKFSGERHQRRVDMITKIEEGETL